MCIKGTKNQHIHSPETRTPSHISRVTRPRPRRTRSGVNARNRILATWVPLFVFLSPQRMSVARAPVASLAATAPRTTWLLAVLLAGQSLANIDTAIVNVATPSNWLNRQGVPTQRNPWGQ
jgi:hypothetical protein